MPRVTKQDLDRRDELIAKRKLLSKESSELAAIISDIETKAAEDLESSGKGHVMRGGRRIELVSGRPSIAWKSEFQRVAGEEEAERILRSAEVPMVLKIT